MRFCGAEVPIESDNRAPHIFTTVAHRHVESWKEVPALFRRAHQGTGGKVVLEFPRISGQRDYAASWGEVASSKCAGVM